MYLLIILLPLLTTILYGFEFLKIKNNNIISLYNYYIFIFIKFFVFLTMLFYILKHHFYTGYVIHIKLYEWVSCGVFEVSWGLLFDSLTFIMLFVVISISFVVHLYSLEYMLFDPYLFRFLAYSSLSTFSMLILITADNLIQLFIGWEGVGLCSYLLINFWYTRISANKAALKALIVNRIGDFGLILGSSICFLTFKSVEYSTIFTLTPFFLDKTILVLNYQINILTLITFCFLFGSIGKSAQLGLHVWLPDAMEGPTPVSALIHAATMVTAGIFLIIRCSFLFEYTSGILILMAFIGSLTCFFSATIGLVQYDIKKIIAYSTCSQLGYMLFACGNSTYITSLFHLTNHAFFKALLFLSAGLIIHAISNEQDIRRFGKLINLLPLLYMFFLIGSLSLSGFFFLSGFYSKDNILESTYLKNTEIPYLFIYWLGSFSTFLTALYSIKIIHLTFFSSMNTFKSYIINFHDSKLNIFNLFILSVLSIFSGFLLKDIFIGLGSNFFNNSIFILPELYIDSSFRVELLPVWIKLIPFFYSILALFIYWYISQLNIIYLYYFIKNYSLTFIRFNIFGFLKKKLLINYNSFYLFFHKLMFNYCLKFLLILNISFIVIKKYTNPRKKFNLLVKFFKKPSKNLIIFSSHKIFLILLLFFFEILFLITFLCLYNLYAYKSTKQKSLFFFFLDFRRIFFSKICYQKYFLKYSYHYFSRFFTKIIVIYTRIFTANIRVFQKLIFLGYLIYTKFNVIFTNFKFYLRRFYFHEIFLFIKHLTYIKLFFFKIIYVCTSNIYKFCLFCYKFLIKRWYFDKLYNDLLNKSILQVSYTYFIKLLDKGVLETFGPTGLGYLIFLSSQKISFFHSGNISRSFFFFLSSFLFFFLIIIIFI